VQCTALHCTALHCTELAECHHIRQAELAFSVSVGNSGLVSDIWTFAEYIIEMECYFIQYGIIQPSRRKV
jgi:hypothetical protein